MARLRRILPVALIAACIGAALIAATASAAVTATVDTTGRLVVDGTIWHDEIVVQNGGDYVVVNDKDRVSARAGCFRSDDVAFCSRSAIDEIVIYGRASDDDLTAGFTTVPTTVLGGNGDDTIEVLGVDDGNAAFGEDGDDTITGAAADDNFNGGNGNDTLNGGPGADFLHGEGGDDVLHGGGQDDRLLSDAGADTLIGDAGADTALYDTHTTAVSVHIGTPAGNGNSLDGPGDDVDATVESIKGTTGADTLLGSDQANTLEGGQGDDLLDGRGGDDLLEPTSGDDTVHGGPGRDRVSYSEATGSVTVVLGGQNDSGPLGSAATIDSEVEDAEGGSANDSFVGTAGPNRFVGGTGFDTVSYAARTAPLTVDADGTADDGAGIGGASPENDNVGVDVEGVLGGRGPDHLTATSSSDGVRAVNGANGTVTVQTRLDGGVGDDRLDGVDNARDQLIGGLGGDTLVARGADDILETNGDGRGDSVDCGAGSFDFARLDGFDQHSGCETIQVTIP